MRAATDTVGFGGALYSMDNVIITDRTAIFDSNAAAVDGGAVYSQAMMTMQGTASQFTGNFAGRHGGAIYNASGVLLFDGQVSADGKKTTLSGNVAGYDFATGAMGTVGSGGALYSMDKISFLGKGSIFEENIAAEYGGAIYSDNDLDFSATSDARSEFNRNIAGKDGGAIYNESGNIDIINAGELIFKNNIAGWDFTTGEMRAATDTVGFGGALYSKADVNITSRNILFDGNTAAVSGGAVAATTGFGISGGANITFIKNSAGAFGGAVYLSGDSVMEDATFTGNTAGKSGGAIYQWDDLTTTQSLTIRAVTNDVVFADNYGGVTSTNTGYQNDINIAAGPVTFATGNAGYNILLGGGITSLDTDASGNEKLNEVHTSSLTMSGTGKVVFGTGSTTFVNGDINLATGTTMQLDHGASFGRFFGVYGETALSVPQKVGHFAAATDTTLAYTFGNDGIAHTVLYGDTVTINDTTQFELSGIKYKSGVMYDLAEASNVANSMSVTTGLDRGAFRTGIVASDPNYFVRDLTYGRSDTGAVYSGSAVANLNNVYAIEFFTMSELMGESPYYDPSWRNRVISDRTQSSRDSQACAVECDPCAPIFTQKKWTPWIQGYGSNGSIGEYDNISEADYRIGGLMVGADYKASRRQTLGLYYGYGKSDTSNYFSKWDGDEHTFGVYHHRKYAVGYSLLSGNVGFNKYSHRRTIGAIPETYTGSTTATTYGAYAEYGIDRYLTKQTVLTPFIGLQYSGLYSGRYDEDCTTPYADDLSLVVSSTRYDSLRGIVGIRHRATIAPRLTWNNALRWEHECLNRVGIVRNGYLNNHAISFERESHIGGRDRGVVGTGFSWSVNSNLELNAGYDFSFNQHATQHTGTAGLTYKF